MKRYPVSILVRLVLTFLICISIKVYADKQSDFVVSIKTRAVFSAYSPTGVSFGTGFIIDTHKGIIVTNKHVARPTDVVTEWTITLHDGREVHADLIYSDPWHDFSFLRIKHESSTKDIQSPKLNTAVKVEDEIVIIGKNENKHFSRQTGTIASLYENAGHLQQQSIRINLNAQGGASGSPVLNKKGEVIGLLFASNGFTSAFALPIAYIQDAFKYVVEGKKPPRLALGCLIDYQSLDEFVRFNNFPNDIATTYRKKYPDARNRALCVRDVLVNTPAEGKILVGDIITQINDTVVGPSLYDLEKAIDRSKGSELTVHLIRNGKPLRVKVGSYDLYHLTIKRIVFFNGGTFFEMDDYIKSKTGCTSEKVFVCQALPSSSFIEMFPVYPGTNSMLVAIAKVNGQEISSLDDLIKAAGPAMQKQYFPVVYKNYGLSFGYDRDPSFNRSPQLAEITYSQYDGIMRVFKFDETQGQWKLEA